jgi:tetratricopeptide (TPR) repeat protein
MPDMKRSKHAALKGLLVFHARPLWPLSVITVLLTAWVLAASPESDQFFNSACQLAGQEKYTEASAEMRKACGLESGNRDYALCLGYLEYMRGAVNQAREVLQPLCESGNSGVLACLLLADIRFREQNLQVALELYRRIEAVDNNIQIVNIRLYDLLKFEDPTEANKYYLKALQLDTTDLKSYLPSAFAAGLRTAGHPQTGPEELIGPAGRQNFSGTNDLSEFFPSSGTNQRSGEEGTNVIIQTKSGHARTLRIFRKFGPEDLFAKIIMTVIVLLAALVWSLLRRRRDKRRAEYVVSDFRKKR